MIRLSNCPICNSCKLEKEFTCVDHSTSLEEFAIVSCETCELKLTNPRPSDQNLAKYYDSEKYISHTNKTDGFFNFLYQKIRRVAITKKVNLIKGLSKGRSHLDVGCGTGEFLNACKNAGFLVRGIEPSKKAREQAEKNYNLSVSEKTDLSQYKDEEFDTISMWHVLEHMPNLNKNSSELYRILKARGKLIVAVPNYKSWDAKYYKKNWAAWDVPIHLWHFSKKSITQLFEKHNFDFVKTKPLIFDSFYVSLLSEEYSKGKKNYIKAFVIGLISNFFGFFSKKGHSSLIYIFEKKN